MNRYLQLGLLGFLGLLSIYFYYFYYPFHNENKDYYIVYIIIAFCFYGVYKLFQSFDTSVVRFSFLRLFIIFCVQLFVMSAMFVGISGLSFMLGSVIFFKVLLFLVLVSVIWLGIYSFGRTCITKTKILKIESEALLILGSIAIGFFLLVTGIFLLATFGLYSALPVLLLLGIMYIVSYKEIQRTLIKIYEYSWEYDLRETGANIRLCIDEMHYFIISLLLSVNFLSVYRPFPIGWDDLGAYMNLPKLLVNRGGLIADGNMYTWELYTGIGHVFSSQTFAFFLNSFAGVIIAIVSYIALKYILKPGKTLFNIPLLGSMVLLMLPMVVFQTAKDMKLDVGLLSMSIIAVTFCYAYYEGSIMKQLSSLQKKALLAFIGILVGLCFTIKLTSLLLFLSIAGVIFFKRGGIFGFLGYFALFFGIFSLGNLWKKMNVIFPSDAKVFSIICIVVGIALLVYASKIISANKVKKALSESLVFFLGFIIAFLPWGIKNLTESISAGSVSIGGLIGGKGEFYVPDYLDIYSQEELDRIKADKERLGMTSGGTTTNEDFGRYFGYEEGINNYLKLPWNLSFQVNQKGEFTDITYIFFALIPILLLYLPYRNEKYKYGVIIALGVLLLYYIPGVKIPIGFNSDGGLVTAHITNGISSILTSIFALISMPYGYIVIFLFFLLPLLYMYYSLEKENHITKIVIFGFVFSTIYVFLWNISSFGVVWYGIVMYFVFFVFIASSLLSAHETDKETKGKPMYITLGIIWIYIIMSVIPHGVTNMRAVGSLEYKLGKQTEEEALFMSHRDYFPILFELNIKREKHEEVFIEYRNRLLEIIDDIQGSGELVAAIQGIPNMTALNETLGRLIRTDLGGLENDVRDLRQELYTDVLYVSEENKSEEIIYRVGTFLKYYISENNMRLYEDSLVEGFETYMYDEDPSVITERLKQMNIGYILLDLNAATIDNDPRKELTKRYESMLRYTTNKNIELIETDSICLRLAREDFMKDGNIDAFMNIATLNHGNRLNKKVACINRIGTLMRNNIPDANNYPYVASLKNALVSLKVDINDDTALRQALSKYVTQGYKALYKIN